MWPTTTKVSHQRAQSFTQSKYLCVHSSRLEWPYLSVALQIFNLRYGLCQHWEHTMQGHAPCSLINKPYYRAGLMGSHSKLVCQQSAWSALTWRKAETHMGWYRYVKIHTHAETHPHRWTCKKRHAWAETYKMNMHACVHTQEILSADTCILYVHNPAGNCMCVVSTCVSSTISVWVHN